MDERDVFELASRHPLLSVLEPAARRALLAEGRLAWFRAKRPLLREGERAEHVFCLLEGSVRVFHRDGRKEVLVKLFRAPALFGEMEVLGQRRFLEYVTTLEPCQVLLLPAAAFRALVQTDARFAAALAFDLSARLCIATHNERSLAFADTETRLAKLLLDYAELSGRDAPGGVRLELKLSQQSMARDLAVSRKSLNRALDRLRREGILTKERARYLIRDAGALRRRTGEQLGLFYRLDRERVAP